MTRLLVKCVQREGATIDEILKWLETVTVETAGVCKDSCSVKADKDSNKLRDEMEKNKDGTKI